MKYLFFVVFSTFFTFGTIAQIVEFDNFTQADKDSVKLLAIDFINKITTQDFSNLEDFITPKETNFNNTVWLKNKDFISLVKTITQTKKINPASLEVFTFDDILQSDKREEVSTKLSNVFTNMHILARVEYTEGNKTSILNIVYGFFNDAWKIVSINFSNVDLNSRNTLDFESFNMEKIENCQVEIPIPAYFSQKSENKGMVSFVLSAETERDAIIQVMCSDLETSIEFITYKWVEKIVSQNKGSNNFIVKMLPKSIYFEYNITDDNGNINKGISLGTVSNGKGIIVQYFSFREVYDIIWRDIDFMYKNIQ